MVVVGRAEALLGLVERGAELLANLAPPPSAAPFRWMWSGDTVTQRRPLDGIKARVETTAGAPARPMVS